MSRRRTAERRKLAPDTRYNSEIVSLLISKVMRCGKRSVASQIIYDALDQVKAKMNGIDPLEALVRAVDNVKPKVEVKSRRVGGATYQVPVEVASGRQTALALRWIIQFAQGRKGVPMNEGLAAEIVEAYQNQGNAVKKREDTHKMAQANRAFAHYRW